MYLLVKWYPLQNKNKLEEEPLNTTEVGLINKAIEERSPIDDDEDDKYNAEGGSKQGKFSYNNNIPRTSLERVNILPYQVKVDRYLGNNKINTIEILENKPKPIVPRLAMQAIPRTSSTSSRAIISPTVAIMMESDVGDNARPPPSYSIATTTTTILSLPQSEKW